MEELCKLGEGIKMAEATLFRVTDEEMAELPVWQKDKRKEDV